MAQKEIIACRDCKYCSGTMLFRCSHSEMEIKTIDFHNGVEDTYQELIDFARDETGKCGREAKFFEPK